MNGGFFSDLLARNRGNADVMRPRLASVFEPAPARDSSEGIEEVFEERSAEEDRDTEFQPESRKPFTTPRTSLNRRESEPVFEPEQTVRPARAQTEPPTPKEQSSVVSPALLIRPAPQSPSENVFRQEQTQQAAPALSTAATPMKPAVTAASDHGRDRELIRERVIETRKEMQVSSQRSPEQRSATVPAITPQPSLALPRIPRFDPAPVAARVAPTEPIVNVTIGRIEVRATTEHEPRKRERAASGVMSLDEYLKTRARGGSR